MREMCDASRNIPHKSVLAGDNNLSVYQPATWEEIKDMTDEEWEAYIRTLNNVGDRIDLVLDTVTRLEDSFMKEDTVNIYEAQLLHDRVNLLFATAIDNELLVDEVGEPVTHDEWKALTSPVYGEDPLVPTAAEFEKQLDLAYADGADEAWDEAYSYGEKEGIDLGIALAGRVLRVLNAQVIDRRSVSQPDATDW